MNREKALETIIVLVLASILAYLWFDVNWLIYLVVGLLVIALISKELTIVVGRGWLSFSNYLGVLMNYLIMFVIFFSILSPLSFFQRLLGNNHILKKSKKDSHFHQRNHIYTTKDIENPW